MLACPPDLDESSLRALLASAWRFPATALTYEPVGFGSHHWTAVDDREQRRFVTVDDLCLKRVAATASTDDVYDHLDRTFEAVRALYVEADLAFVVAPLPATDGRVLQRLNDRYSVVVHPYLAGRPAGRHGAYESDADRMAVLELVVALHQAPASVSSAAVPDDGLVPNRDALRDAIAVADRDWDTGPYAERARRLLVAHTVGVEHLLDVYDTLCTDVLAGTERLVMTHGEPHAANVVVADGKLFVVDWDTARVAPPERDLWDLDSGDGVILERYTASTGVDVQPAALTLYRLWYDLAEIAGYIAGFRAPHIDDANAAESWRNLRHFLQPRSRWPTLFS